MPYLNWIAGVVAISLLVLAVRYALRTGARMAEPSEYQSYRGVNAEKLRELKEAGDLAGTEKFLRECNRRFPNAPQTYFDLFDFIRNQGRHEEALQILSRTEKLLRARNEIHRDIIYALNARQVHLLWHFKRDKEADAVARAALDWGGRDHRLVEIAISTAERLSDQDHILQALLEACAEFPDDLSLTERLFRAYVKRGDIPNAEAVLVEAQSRYPQSIRLFIPHARLAHERGDWEEAAQRWAVIQERFVLNAEGFEKGAEALRHLGRDAEAEAVMEQHPGHRAVPWPLT